MAETDTSKKYIKINDEWTEIDAIYKKIQGSWIELGTPFVRINGTWVQGDIPKPAPLVVVPFDTATDEEITNIINGYYEGLLTLEDITAVWQIGDTRSINLSAMPATGVGESHRAQTVEMQILDFNHDDLVTAINGKTKALITVDQKNCLMTESDYNNIIEGHPDIVGSRNENGYINSTNDNTTRWQNCSRRAWCNETYYNSLPVYLKALNKKVKKVADNSYTEDNIFFLSEYEVTATTNKSAYIEGTQYPLYQTKSRRVKLPRWSTNDNGTYSNIWWLRSPYKSGTTYWCEITESLVCDMHNASKIYGLAPAMCL